MDPELYNTGIVKPEYVKNIIHAFCGAVLYECRRNNTYDIEAAAKAVYDNMSSCSSRDSNGLKPIGCFWDLLGWFFDQKNIIPGYIFYFLGNCYADVLDCRDKSLADYTIRHFNTYNALHRCYVNYRRWLKSDEKENRQYFNQSRRKICKMYSSGKYTAAFKLYNKGFINSIPEKQFKDISDLIMMLFPKEMSMCKNNTEAAALGYIIGRIQGASEAAEAAQSTDNKLSDAIINKVSKCTDKHILVCIHSFISSLVF